jgi:Undecaprenyl-phosphate glucose phosphotransferase
MKIFRNSAIVIILNKILGINVNEGSNMIKENQKSLNRLGVLLDAVAIIISLKISWYIRFDSGLIYAVDAEYLSFTKYLKPIFLIIPVYLLLYTIFKLYTPHRYKSIYEESSAILKANIIGILIFIMFLYLFKEINYSRYLLFIFLITSTLVTMMERAFIRFILHRIRENGYNLKHIVVIGYNKLTIEFLNRIKRNKQWGYNILAILDEDPIYKSTICDKRLIYTLSLFKNTLDEIAATKSCEESTIEDLAKLEYYLNNFHIDEVFVTLSIKQYDKLGEIIELCEKNGVRTQIIPDYYKYIPAKPYVEELDGLPVINIRYVPLDNLINKVMKRIFDIIAALSAIIIFSPIMLISAIVIKITSPGPILFMQERVGLNKKMFKMYKFRSMKIQKFEDEVTQWTTKNDSRKTKLGNFIRKTSIDELPQLFNVLKGDMSLIGPRPERPYFVEQFKEQIPKYMIKHQVRPGMTGWAQVNGWRGDTSIEKRIEHDIYYIENWSFWLDIKIIFYTIIKGFVNENAY